MSEKIYWTLNIQVTGGPKISEANVVEIDAYDTVNVTIENDGNNDKEVQIQPGELDDIHFLIIRSDKYGDALTYKVNDTANKAIKLDSLQVLIGSGATGLLGAKPDKLFFTNNLVSDGNKIPATIQILVGRKAT